jgi:ribosomal protein S18 acetylase RimI-like enzyme
VLKDRKKLPVGIVTLSDKEGAGDLTLVGLRKEYTGRGLGRVLILRALAELARREIWNATVSTQGENFAALHAYCDAGFLPTGSRVVLHRWRE